MIGHLDSHPEFPSRHVAPRQVDIWLPPGYDSDGEPLKVLYMHDGQCLFHAHLCSTQTDWDIDRTLADLVATGRVRPTMVVGIWNTEKRNAEYLPNAPFSALDGRRTLEAMHLALEGRQPEPGQYDEGPLSDAYLQFIVEEVKPFVDQHYNTWPDREQTFIMGSSMGGLVSLYAICQFPKIFAGAGCLSTHWPPVAEVIEGYLIDRLPKPGRHRLYFDYGTETLDSLYEPHQQCIDKVLRAAGYTAGEDWVTRRFEGAEHNEFAWRERLHIPLEFLLA